MSADQFEKLAAGVLALYGNDDGLAGSGVIRRLLAFAEQVAKDPRHAEVCGIGKADACQR